LRDVPKIINGNNQTNLCENKLGCSVLDFNNINTDSGAFAQRFGCNVGQRRNGLPTSAARDSDCRSTVNKRRLACRALRRTYPLIFYEKRRAALPLPLSPRTRMRLTALMKSM
jgi:hypothetical protein